jgi:hypothetical protein
MKRASKEEFCTQTHKNPEIELNSAAAASYIRPLKNNYFRMNKIICILMSVLILGVASFAQNKDTKNTKAAPKQTTAKTSAGKQGEAPKGESKPAPKMKKDGTPDMRHKENKEAAKPAPKLKKDGTPDMRYKQNKDAAKKK